MSYNVEATTYFARQLKRLVKKYPSMKMEFSLLVKSLKENPEQGVSLGNHCYKIRFSITSKGKGKSGAARVVTHVQVLKTKVFLLSIYDKSDQPNISKKDLDLWIKNL